MKKILIFIVLSILLLNVGTSLKWTQPSAESSTSYTHLSNFTDDVNATQTHLSNLTDDINATGSFNATYDALTGGNASWNQSYAHTLFVNVTGDTMTGQLVIQEGNGKIVATNAAGALSAETSAGNPGYISFGNTADIGISTDGTVSGYDYDGSFIFKQKTSNPDSIGEFIWIEENGNWRFALPSSGADYGTYNPRSFIIAGPSINNASAFNCTYWGFDQLDCDTSGTGADLGVQDDLQVLGAVYVDGTVGNDTDRYTWADLNATSASASVNTYWKQDGIAIANDTSDVRIDNGLFYYNTSRTMLTLGEADSNGITDAIITSDIGDSILVQDTTEQTSGSQRTSFFFSSYNNSATSSATLYGFNSFVYWWGGAGTAIGQLGSGAGGRYAFRLGSNNNIQRATGASSLVQTVGSSTGTIQNGDAFVSEGGNTVSTSTIVNYTGFRARDYGTSEDITHNYGFSCDTLADGSSSNYCFYDDYNNNNYLRYLGLGAKTMEASSSLTVGGGTIAFSDATYGLAWKMPQEGLVRYGVKVGTAGSSNDQDIIALTNRADNGDVQIQANDGTAGAGGETLVASFNASGGYARQGIGVSVPGVTALNNYKDFNQLHVKGTNIRIIGEGSGQSALVLMDTGASTNEKWLDFIVDGGLGKIRAINDATTLKYNIMIANLSDGNVFFPQAYSNDLAAETTAVAYLSSNGELGIDTSSERFKTNIRDATTNDNCFENLNWRVYDRIGGASNELGLIAEEVALVCPQYVINEVEVTQVPYEVPAWQEVINHTYTPEPVPTEVCYDKEIEVPVLDNVGENTGEVNIIIQRVCSTELIEQEPITEQKVIQHPATIEYKEVRTTTNRPYSVRYDLIARDMAIQFNGLNARVTALERGVKL